MKRSAMTLCFFVFSLAGLAGALGQDIFRQMDIPVRMESPQTPRTRARRILRADPYSPAEDSRLATRAIALLPDGLPPVYLANHLKTMGLKQAKRYGSVFVLRNQDGQKGLFLNADTSYESGRQFADLEQVFAEGNDDAAAIVAGWIVNLLAGGSWEAELKFLNEYGAVKTIAKIKSSGLLEQEIRETRKELERSKKRLKH